MPAGTKLKPVRQTVSIRDCRKKRKENSYRTLDSKCWDEFLHKTNVEDTVNKLETMIHTHMNRCMPFRTVSMLRRESHAR